MPTPIFLMNIIKKLRTQGNINFPFSQQKQRLSGAGPRFFVFVNKNNDLPATLTLKKLIKSSTYAVATILATIVNVYLATIVNVKH